MPIFDIYYKRQKRQYIGFFPLIILPPLTFIVRKYLENALINLNYISI